MGYPGSLYVHSHDDFGNALNNAPQQAIAAELRSADGATKLRKSSIGNDPSQDVLKRLKIQTWSFVQAHDDGATREQLQGGDAHDWFLGRCGV